MSKVKCNIIKDLLPLYVDAVVSEDSKLFVEEHLQECEECRCELEALKKNICFPTETKVSPLKALKKKLFRKNLKVAILSTLGAAAIIIGGMWFIFSYQIPIEYKDKLLDVKLASDGVIDITFNSDDYYRTYAFSTTIEKDGIKQNVVYLYYSDSIWTKYFTNKQNHVPYQFSIGNTIMVDYGMNGKSIPVNENTTAIYYLIGDYQELSSMSYEKLSNEAGKSILIWEK